MKTILKLLCLTLVLLLGSCSKDRDDEQHLRVTSCDQWVTVDEVLYKQGSGHPYTIESLALSGDCLHISLTSGGCSGETWEVSLIDSGTIAESFPPQRFLRLHLKNEELCNAMVTKKISFDISDLQMPSGEKVILHIEGGGSVVLGNSN